MKKDERVLKYLTLEVSNECPLQCIFCSSGVGHVSPASYSLSDIQSIIDDVIELGCEHVAFSGGEPLMYPNIVDAVKYVKEKGLAVSVYTSGNIKDSDGNIVSIPDSMLKELSALSVDSIFFSIHGGNASVHDSISKVEGSFNNLIISVEDAVAYGLNTEFHFVPLKNTYEEITKIYKIAEDVGVNSIKVLRFVPQGNGATDKDNLSMDRTDAIRFKEILLHLISDGKVPIKVGAHFSVLLLGDNQKCGAGISKASILPDKYMVPCSSMKSDIFKQSDNSIEKNSIEDIWDNSLVFRLASNAIDQILESECLDCEHFYSCHGGCQIQRILYNGDVSKNVDPLCIIWDLYANEGIK